MQPDFEVLKRNKILDQPYFSKLSIVDRVKEKIVIKYFEMNFYPKIKKQHLIVKQTQIRKLLDES